MAQPMQLQFSYGQSQPRAVSESIHLNDCYGCQKAKCGLLRVLEAYIYYAKLMRITCACFPCTEKKAASNLSKPGSLPVLGGKP